MYHVGDHASEAYYPDDGSPRYWEAMYPQTEPNFVSNNAKRPNGGIEGYTPNNPDDDIMEMVDNSGIRKDVPSDIADIKSNIKDIRESQIDIKINPIMLFFVIAFVWVSLTYFSDGVMQFMQSKFNAGKEMSMIQNFLFAFIFFGIILAFSFFFKIPIASLEEL